MTTTAPTRRHVDIDIMPDRDESSALAAAVWIGADSPWACPILLSDVGGQYPSLDNPAIARTVQQDFKALVTNGRLSFPNWRSMGGQRGPVTFNYPDRQTIATALQGRDLACYCPPDEACHGDVLLRIANPEHLCPECAQGKHRNCAEITLDDHDNWTPCNCHTITQHSIPTAAALAAVRREAKSRP